MIINYESQLTSNKVQLPVPVQKREDLLHLYCCKMNMFEFWQILRRQSELWEVVIFYRHYDTELNND